MNDKLPRIVIEHIEFIPQKNGTLRFLVDYVYDSAKIGHTHGRIRIKHTTTSATIADSFNIAARMILKNHGLLAGDVDLLPPWVRV